MFLVNSRHPLVCAPRRWLPSDGAPFSRSYGGILPSSFNTVLSSASVCSTSPPVSVSGTVHQRGLFPGRPWRPGQSDQSEPRQAVVTTRGPRNINLVAIGYAFRPRLRGRLTLRGLALRRNPWTFGDRVSHPVDRYSCQHSHFRYLQGASRHPFTGLRNAPLPLRRQRPEDRRQMVHHHGRRAPVTTSGPLGRSAFGRSPDTRRANAATSRRRYSPDHGNTDTTRASRRPTRWQSPDTA